MQAERTRSNKGFLIAGLVIALLVAFGLSGFASSAPDGLERVAEDQGFAADAKDHRLADTPVADYSVRGVDNERVSTGLAGVLGVALTFAFAGGLFWVARRRRPPAPPDPTLGEA